MTSKTKVATPSNLFRTLSNVFLINSAEFSTKTPAEQTKLLASAGTLPIKIVPNFITIADRVSLRNRLLNGEDVSMEIEFNGIELTDEDRATLATVRPVLEKILGPKPVYEWAKGKASSMTMNPTFIRRNGHDIDVSKAKRLWKIASRYWAGGSKPKNSRITQGWHHHSVSFSEVQIKIGCQQIPRVDVEAIAKHYGWEPNLD